VIDVAPLVCVGREFSQDDRRARARRFEKHHRWADGWQCQFHSFRHRTFRHCASGLTFATDPRVEADRVWSSVWLALPAGAEPPRYTRELVRLGYDAREVRLFAIIVNWYRRHDAGLARNTPFLIRVGRRSIEFEDASPLPRVRRFAHAAV